MAYLEIKNVSKSFGAGRDKVEVLSNINLSVEEGEFLCLIGFSGSGKSTLIKLIMGLEKPDTGEIWVNGKQVKGPDMDRGIMFQNYSLLPWLTVSGNVGMASKIANPKMKKDAAKDHVEKHVEMVSLSHALEKLPAELSGGMRQRVSVARALSMSPKMLLMDEPLSALDALTRAVIQQEFIKIWEADKKTVVMITNDVDEALLLSDRIIPLTNGPQATLGPEFKVKIDRPRDKTAMNSNEEFKTLRNEITRYLLMLNEENKNSVDPNKYTLPDLKPKVKRRKMLF